jgi:cupin fold WbuC family metalloprotein
MRMREIGPAVYQADGPIVGVTRDEIGFLKEKAIQSVAGRARLCAHPGPQDATQEMLIVLGRTLTYIHPHVHPGKVESFHVMEGKMTVVFFEDDGRILEALPMGDFASGRAFYYRQQRSIYHTILPETDYVAFQEVTQGPFSRENTVLAPWCPAEKTGLQGFIDDLRKKVGVA